MAVALPVPAASRRGVARLALLLRFWPDENITGPGARLATLDHPRLDLLAPPAEGLDHVPWDAADVGGPVVRLLELDPERAGQPLAKLGLVEVAGGLGMAVDGSAVDRSEPALWSSAMLATSTCV